ncbi:AAA family ATPase [Thermodesulfobacteriota bacterium]
MAVITISRQFGAGGRTLGKMIAEKLDYKFLDDVIIQAIAKEAKVSTSTVKSMERIAGGTLSKLFSGLINSNYIERLIGGGKGYLNEEIYLDVLNKVMNELAEQDNVVLMGRGGQYILADFENAYHLLLVSDVEHRIEFMKKYYNMNPEKAADVIKIGEKKRTVLYKKMHKEDYNSPNHYHLTLNMSILSLEEALALVCSLVSAHP